MLLIVSCTYIEYVEVPMDLLYNTKKTAAVVKHLSAINITSYITFHTKNLNFKCYYSFKGSGMFQSFPPWWLFQCLLYTTVWNAFFTLNLKILSLYYWYHKSNNSIPTMYIIMIKERFRKSQESELRWAHPPFHLQFSSPRVPLEGQIFYCNGTPFTHRGFWRKE